MWLLGTVARPLSLWKWLLLACMTALFVAVLALPAARDFFALDLGEWRMELLVAGLCAVSAVALLEVLHWWGRRWRPGGGRWTRILAAEVS